MPWIKNHLALLTTSLPTTLSPPDLSFPWSLTKTSPALPVPSYSVPCFPYGGQNTHQKSKSSQATLLLKFLQVPTLHCSQDQAQLHSQGRLSLTYSIYKVLWECWQLKAVLESAHTAPSAAMSFHLRLPDSAHLAWLSWSLPWCPGSD